MAACVNPISFIEDEVAQGRIRSLGHVAERKSGEKHALVDGFFGADI